MMAPRFMALGDYHLDMLRRYTAVFDTTKRYLME
jgi:hypothetical protein